MKLPNSFQLFIFENPFIRLLVPFSVGIGAQLFFEWHNLFIPSICLFTSILMYAAFQTTTIKLKFKWHFVAGILLQFSLFFVGIVLTQPQFITNQNNYYGNYIHSNNQIIAIRLLENPIEKASSYKALAEVESINKQPTIGKTIVYFSKKNYSHQYKYGDKLLVPNHFTGIKNSGNPGCYNYQFSCLLQDVTHQIFLKEQEAKCIGNTHNPFYKLLWDFRENILATMQANILSKKELGVAQALLIGYRDNLDKDLQQTYSNTGIVHVLAISGMHLGLIFWLLNFCLCFLDKNQKTRLLKSIIVLTIIWVFALLTGASGSVMRAAVMFTFMQAANLIHRKPSIYNALAASAFVMMVYHPFILADVGFQLSYIAVIGIVALQKYIYNWIYVKNWWLKKIWNLMAVSIAAQIVAAPICMFYFHQFPNYFLLANLIAIPLSTVVLFEIIALLVVALIYGLAAKALGSIITFTTFLMNCGIEWVDSLPHSVINNLQFSVIQIIILYASIFSIIFWLINKKINFLKIGLLSFLIFLISVSIDDWQIKHQQKIIVYAIPNGSAIDFISGNSYGYFYDTMVTKNHITQNFHIKPAHVLFQATQLSPKLTATIYPNHFMAFNRKIIYLSTKQKPICSITKIDADIIVIAHNSIYSLHDVTKNYTFNLLIFDSSNSNYKTEKWMKEASDLGLQAYSTNKSGAYILNCR
jgi:competence protein ComEC